MKERLKQLYKKIILQHNAAPYHFEKKEGTQYRVDAYNPLCGDRFQLFFDIENGVIDNIYFFGYGCAISKASTSVLVEALEKKTLKNATTLCEEFLNVIHNKETDSTIEKEEFEAFSAAKDFPGREKCATLSWDEFKLFLEKM